MSEEVGSDLLDFYLDYRKRTSGGMRFSLFYEEEEAASFSSKRYVYIGTMKTIILVR